MDTFKKNKTGTIDIKHLFNIITLKRNPKAQIWLFDFIVGIVLFLSVVFVSFKLMSNASEGGTQSTLDYLDQQANILKYSLTSKGQPANWNLTNVSSIGVVNSDYSLNNTKLYYLYNLTNQDSIHVNTLLGISSKFAIVLYNTQNMMLNFTFNVNHHKINVSYIGWKGFNATNISTFVANHGDVVVSMAIVNNLSNLLKMKIFVWQ